MTSYAVSLSGLNKYQQQCHPIYWLLAPLLADEVVDVGSRFDDSAVVLNSDTDRWPAVAAVLVDADIAGQGYLWNSLKFYCSNGGAWHRVTPQDLMDIGASAWEAMKEHNP